MIIYHIINQALSQTFVVNSDVLVNLAAQTYHRLASTEETLAVERAYTTATGYDMPTASIAGAELNRLITGASLHAV